MTDLHQILGSASIPGEEFSALVMAYSAIGDAEVRTALLDLMTSIAGGRANEVFSDRLVLEWA